MPKIIDDGDVFRATVEMFVARGYEGTTTKLIAQDAGVHEVTLFRKYGSKGNLIVQAIQHELSDVPLARLDYTGDLAADLLAIVRAYLATAEQHGDIIPSLLTQIPQHPELKQAMAVPMANIQGITEIIQRYQAEGHLMQEHPGATMHDLLGPLILRQMFRRAYEGQPGPPFDERDYVAFFSEWERDLSNG